jgi:hypothetical protein
LSVAQGRCFSACEVGLVCDLRAAVPTRARSGSSVIYGRGFCEYEPRHVRDLPFRPVRVRRVRDLWSAF